jgi:hypothetical protein
MSFTSTEKNLFMTPARIGITIACVLIALFAGWTILFREPLPASADPGQTVAGAADFQPALHQSAVYADTLEMLFSRVWPGRADISRQGNKLTIAVRRLGSSATAVYNSNAALLEVRSGDFSIKHNRATDEVILVFQLKPDSNGTMIAYVPNDILYALVDRIK